MLNEFRISQPPKIAEKLIKNTDVPNDSRVRCHTKQETVQYITVACPLLVLCDYVRRNNQLGNTVDYHLTTLKYNIVSVKFPCYNYNPVTVLENAT